MKSRLFPSIPSRYVCVACLLGLGFFITPKKLMAQSPDSLLLKDYDPVSLFHIPKTRLEKARFPAIDMHTHVYPTSKQEIESWMHTMDQVGIEKTVILTYAHGEAFDSLMQVYAPFSDRFELWCGIDYSGYDAPGFGPAAVAELERCFSMGARGVGEMGDKGKGLFYFKPAAWGMHPDDPRMDPIYEKCAELGMPINIHVAEPIWMYQSMDAQNDGLMNAYTWRLDNKTDLASHDEMIRRLENTIKKHPETTFIACHLANCSYNLDIAARLLETYPNLFMDIGARFAEFSATPRRTSRFMRTYQDRLLYGTDMGMDAQMYRFTFRILETDDEHIYDRYNSYHWPLHGLDLSPEVLKKIYRLNAQRILNGSLD